MTLNESRMNMDRSSDQPNPTISKISSWEKMGRVEENLKKLDKIKTDKTENTGLIHI